MKTKDGITHIINSSSVGSGASLAIVLLWHRHAEDLDELQPCQDLCD